MDEGYRGRGPAVDEDAMADAVVLPRPLVRTTDRFYAYRQNVPNVSAHILQFTILRSNKERALYFSILFSGTKIRRL